MQERVFFFFKEEEQNLLELEMFHVVGIEFYLIAKCLTVV